MQMQTHFKIFKTLFAPINCMVSFYFRSLAIDAHTAQFRTSPIGVRSFGRDKHFFSSSFISVN